MKRVFLGLVGLLVVAVLVVAGLGVYVIRRPFPTISGTVKIQGLRGQVEVIRDRWGVPHVFAASTHDLFFAQGYVHAQDRLWQMEFNRRAASGRLSEIFGAVTLDTDRFLRVIGLRRAAEAEWTTMDAETRAVFDAYAAGVNAFVAQHAGNLPVEFALLRFRPQPWTPVDSLAFAKLMAWRLSGNWESELLRAHFVSRFGEEGARVLMPPYPEDSPIIVPAEANYQAWNQDALLRLVDLSARIPGRGSNNWVVSGGRTATGRPILANDPHLEALMPSIWYEMHLSGGPVNVIGVTFPGTPAVIIGHNNSIAWGFTNAGPDVQDLYIEQFHPRDPTRYLYRGQWEQATVVREEIRVKGRALPLIETVRITRHGPIINSVVDGLGAYLALRWTALDPGTVAVSIQRLNRARNWQEFREAVRLFTVPAQNLVYADRDGNIGYQLPGRIPIRANGNGLVPVPGWTGEYEWIGEVPFEELPSVFNPDRGFIVTANNRITPEGYKHLISVEWDPGFRARRIQAMLEALPKATVDHMKQIQMDVTSLPGQITVQALRNVQISEEPAAGLLAELKTWDGVLRADSRAAVIYEAFRISLLEVVFRDALGPDLFKRYREQSSFWQVALLQLLQDPASGWWGPEGRDAKVARALAEAHSVLTDRLGRDRSTWTWGRLHVMEFVHLIGQVPALGWIFNATAPPTGGDGFTVNNAAFSQRTFRQGVVASYRQVLDLDDWDRSIAIHTTGQSGLPFHRHYTDFVPMWATGQYHPLLFSRGRIQQEAEGALTLAPP